MILRLDVRPAPASIVRPKKPSKFLTGGVTRFEIRKCAHQIASAIRFVQRFVVTVNDSLFEQKPARHKESIGMLDAILNNPIGEQRGESFYIGEIDGRGLGLCASKSISAGETVTENIARRIPPTGVPLPHEMTQFLFVEPHPYLQDRTRNWLMVCGPMTLVNHSDSPNCVVDWAPFYEGGYMVTLKAVQKIEAGEELTTAYTNYEDYVANGDSFVP